MEQLVLSDKGMRKLPLSFSLSLRISKVESSISSFRIRGVRNDVERVRLPLLLRLVFPGSCTERAFLSGLSVR